MAVPKKRKSRSKTRMRRAHQGLTAPNVSSCESCGEVTLPHQACPSCGAYKGRQVLKGKES